MVVVIVVADIFDLFSRKKGLIKFGELSELLDKNASSAYFSDINFIPGQGLGVAEINGLYDIALSRGLQRCFLYWRLWGDKVVADRQSSHKHKHNPNNVLISNPVRLEESVFESNLIVHHQNELMNDHVTGEHIQGMILVEACRQMFLAVKESYFLTSFPAEKKYFTIDEMNVSYFSFVFPVDAKIRYKAIDFCYRRPDKIQAVSLIEVIQNEVVTTAMNVKFTIFDAGFIARKEFDLANLVLTAQREYIRSQIKNSF